MVFGIYLLCLHSINIFVMSQELKEFSSMIDERFELADTNEEESILYLIISWFI